MKLVYSLFLLFLFSSACRPNVPTSTDTTTIDTPSVELQDTVPTPPPVPPRDYDTTQWLELIELDASILLDIRYATDSNFVGEVLYDCARCFLRPAAARAIAAAHQELRAEGLGFKMFDCYRPRDVQFKLWEIYPEPGYVADPRKGSIHNRGGAVDLTIVKADGTPLAMGTEFDFFGPEANHTYTNFPDDVLNNRRKLKTLLKKHGFNAIRSEWWHYNFSLEQYPLADEMWNCETE